MKEERGRKEEREREREKEWVKRDKERGKKNG